MTVMQWRARLPRIDDIPSPVHDGDTLWLETDQGDWYRKVRDCRLRDVFAPELSQPGGIACRDFARLWVWKWQTGIPAKIGQGSEKWPFWVDTYRTSTNRDLTTLSRFVTDVFNADRSSSLNDEMQKFITENGYLGGIGS